MNTQWSTYVQRAETLYQSRVLRFSDRFREKYKNAFAIDEKASILEIGCGPGALSEALARWHPTAKITGVDRDSNFINFAKKKAPHIHFQEEDATNLSFEDESFDVTISNTVAEHIAPEKFYGEQHRVLKKGGVCLVLSAGEASTMMHPASQSNLILKKRSGSAPKRSARKPIKKMPFALFPKTRWKCRKLWRNMDFILFPRNILP